MTHNALLLRSTTMKVSFSLAKKPETPSTFQLKKPPAPVQKPALFNPDEDDDNDGLSLASDPKAKKNGVGLQTVSAETSKAQKKRELAEMAVDSTVYQYDEVWDKIQTAKQKVKEAKMAETKERKVRTPHSVSLRFRDTPDGMRFRSLSISRGSSRPPALGGWTGCEQRKR